MTVNEIMNSIAKHDEKDIKVPMIGDLIRELDNCAKEYEFDREMAHLKADALLLKYINSEDVVRAFKNVPKWYD